MTDKMYLQEAVACLQSRVDEMKWSIENNHVDDERGLRIHDVLEIKKMRCLDVLLSWGGPSEWIRVIVDDQAINSISFHYAHWFFVTEVALTQTQEEIIESWINHVILPCIDFSHSGFGGHNR